MIAGELVELMTVGVPTQQQMTTMQSLLNQVTVDILRLSPGDIISVVHRIISCETSEGR